jgi:hypothetical protein
MEEVKSCVETLYTSLNSVTDCDCITRKIYLFNETILDMRPLSHVLSYYPLTLSIAEMAYFYERDGRYFKQSWELTVPVLFYEHNNCRRKE